jgi:hypothetical protein
MKANREAIRQAVRNHPEWKSCPHRTVRYLCSFCKPHGVYAAYKRRARLREMAFTLTQDDFQRRLLGDCAYCGRTPAQANGMGVDRYLNSEGYTPENSRSCCALCNHFKSNLSASEFLKHASRIAMHNYEFGEVVTASSPESALLAG